MVTINVYIRLGHDGSAAALTHVQIENGLQLSDDWDDDGPYREFVIAVEATPPKTADGEAPDASVKIPDEAPSAVTAAA